MISYIYLTITDPVRPVRDKLNDSVLYSNKCKLDNF